MTPIIALVLKSGGDYEREHAIRLWLQLIGTGGWSGRVVCLTDQVSGWAPADLEQLPLTRGWKGWWSKLELCAPEHDHLGDILFMDLDTVVVGDISKIAAVGQLTMLDDFNYSGRLASGVMYLPVKDRQRAWWLLHEGAGPELVIRTFRRTGDQAFFGMAWHGDAETFQNLLPGQIVSYKKHVKPAGGWDRNARLICYHGKPRPWEVA